MNNDLNEHKNYTQKEYNSLKYYDDLFNILKTKNILSYIDIGANIGEVCNIYFDQLKELKMAYLFEVNPYTFDLLKNNIKNKDNVKLYNTAIYYGKTPPKLFNKNNIGHTMVGNNSIEDVIKDRVEQFFFVDNGEILNYTTLEELKLPIVDLVKIDIEGGEFNIIENSSYLHEIKYLEIEFHHHQSNISIEEYISKSLKQHKIILEEDIKGRFLLERIDNL